MSILKDVFRELWKMFVSDLRLTLASLAAVALTDAALAAGLLSPVFSGGVLAAALIAVLAEAVMRPARRAVSGAKQDNRGNTETL